MGDISQQLRVEFLQLKNQKVVSLKEFSDGKKQANELMADMPALRNPTEGDPAFKAYTIMQNMLSVLSEQLTILPQLEGHAHIIERAEEEYGRGGPPASPITNSFFTYWAFFDVRYGADKETVASIIVDLGDLLEPDPEFLLLVKLCLPTRMGFYEHRGIKNGYIQLRELVTNRSISAICPSGYEGVKGQLWFVRVLPPPVDGIDYHVLATTPYVLMFQGKEEWLEFFERKGIVEGAVGSEELLNDFLKFGPKKNRYFWPEYLFYAYATHESDHVSLMGIPDIQSSMPHHPKSSLRVYKTFPSEARP